ncbi:MAG: GNAT family N-acetyltransferase [Prochlorothrix sp.]|nr:GNAT family N-acetyltransferase [Prochlorothrix sp.]
MSLPPLLSWQVAPLNESLLPAAVDLDRRCLGGLWSIESYRQELERPQSILLGLLPATAQPTPSFPLGGTACLWSVVDEAHVNLLAIAPELQGRGWGQVLLSALLIAACDRQLEWATLEVSTTNLPALRLYQKFGFEQLGIRKGYYHKTGADAAILWLKHLQDPPTIARLRALGQQGWDRVQDRSRSEHRPTHNQP